MKPAARGVLTGLCASGCVLAALAFAPACALANRGYAFSKSFGGQGAGAGQLELTYEGQGLPSKSGVAVDDETGDVYVADTDDRRVDVFNGAGVFQFAFGKEVEPVLKGGVCTSLTGCQKGAGGSEPGALQAPSFIAVDNSSRASRGDVYVGTGVGGEANDELQTIFNKTRVATGAYTLTFEGEETEPIPFDQSFELQGFATQEADEAAQKALEKLPKIGKGNVGVGRDVEGPGAYATITFEGALAEQAVPQLGVHVLSGPVLEVRTEQEGARSAPELISKFTAEGVLISSWGVAGQFAPSSFDANPGGIATDTAGDLWTYAQGLSEPPLFVYGEHVSEFNENAGSVREPWDVPPGHGFGSPGADRPIAVDGSGDVYLGSEGGVFKFTPGGVPLPGGAGPPVSGLAADQASDEVYVDHGRAIEDVAPTGGELASFSSPGLEEGGGAGLAVQPSSATVYEANASRDQVEEFTVALEVDTDPAGEETATSVTLEGEVDPQGGKVVECEFQYATDQQFKEDKGFQGTGVKTAACEPSELGEGVAFVPVAAKLTGLLGGATYHFRLLATHENTITHEDTTVAGDAEVFSTLPVPVIAGSRALDISETSADLTATVDPEGLPVSSCVFEYGTSTSYGLEVPCQQTKKEIGAGSVPVILTAALTGLAPDTTYHWRLVVSDKNGSSLQAPGGSADHTFIYALPSSSSGGCPDEQARVERGSTGLPDCRAYELVTPPEKNGALVGEEAEDEVSPLISDDGRHLVAPSIQCFAGPESCTAIRGGSEGDPYEFSRTPSGWSTRPLAPPASSYETNSWKVLSANGTALFLAPSEPEGLTDDWLAREEDGTLQSIGPLGEHAGEPPFGPTPPNYLALEEEGVIATTDLSHVLYETHVPVWGFDPTVKGESLYEYASPLRTPLLVGVKGGFENHELISTCGTSYGDGYHGSRKVYGSLSEDGRIVYFTAVGHDQVPGCAGSAPPVDELYVRVDGEGTGARSVALSVDPPQATCAHEPCESNAASEFRDAWFEGASSDGSDMLFTDTQQLTEEASQSTGSASTPPGCSGIGGPGGCNLYESVCVRCDGLSGAQEAAARSLVDVSETNEHSQAAGGPRVQGVVAISSDGSHVYFVAKGVLTGSEENANHERAESEGDNLYVYAQGRRVFIAQLSPVTDTKIPESRDDQAEWRRFLPANVTPDGRFLVFTSTRALTSDVTRGEGPAQVYEYDAETRGLVRVSVGEDGYNDDGNDGEGYATVVPLTNKLIAGSVPMRRDPSMSDNGEFVFFQSPVALVPGALDDVRVPGPEGALDEGFAQNVYEFHDGQVSLISDGKDTTGTPGGDSAGEVQPVELIGSDAEGKNVFFATFDQLVPEDSDTQRDYYDAHLCSESEPCTPPLYPAPSTGCVEGSCHASPAPGPGFETPSSLAFSGPGNLDSPPPLAAPAVKPKPLTRAQKLAKALKACRRKHDKQKRQACEKAARKKYAAKASKAAKHHAPRRAARTHARAATADAHAELPGSLLALAADAPLGS